MRTNYIFNVLAALALLSACDDSGRSDLTKLQAELAAVKTELASVKQERDDLKFGPARMLAELDALGAKGSWAETKAQAEALLARHPSAPEATKASEWLKKADGAIAQQLRNAELAQAKIEEDARKLKAQEERRLAAALSKMTKKVDQIENVTWYREQTSPRFSNYNGFFLYIGKRAAEHPWLRLRVQYNADTWLFIESFLVVADGQRFEYNSAKFERDNDSEIWEWYDENASSSDLEMIHAVINSKSAVVRFNGRQYRRDRTMNAQEKAALRNVLDAYKVLGGT